MPRSGAILLSDLPGPHVELACTKCERKGRLLRSKLIEEYGADTTLPDLRVKIARCEREGNFLNGCGAYYVALKPAS
jgi:hypothetical protein